MNKRQFTRVWWLILIGTIISSWGYSLFFWTQENVYHDPNILKPLSDVLGGQTSATSYFIVLMVTSAVCLGFLALMGLIGLAKTVLAVLGLYLIPIAGALVYTYYEYMQSAHPTYPDNYGLDMILGWLACFTVWTLVTVALRVR